MTMLESLPPFDPGFASPSEWAAMYRACGIQVVPAPYPMRTAADKRPNLAGWKEFHDELVADDLFAKWFPPYAKPNMGAIAGAASGRLLVIDLDEYKPTVGANASAWWRDVTGGVDPETWQQRTGGGGRQIFFRLPPGLSIGNASAHALGVDIRCQAGFALMPPTMHMSGTAYRWLDGFEPWNIELDTASPEIIDAVIELIEQHGGGTMSGGEKTPSPDAVTDAFGNIIDGREALMRDMVWARMIDMRRESPIIPGADELEEQFTDLFCQYERKVTTRHTGCDKAAGLEREGRGLTAFAIHWKRALKKWDGQIAREAEKPRPFDAEDRPKDRPKPASELFNAALSDPPKAGEAPAIFEALNVRGIKNMPDPKWLIDGLMTETALGFVFGPPGCGKSFITIGMALCIAAGVPTWWGRPIQKHGAVIYVSSEGQSDLKFRIAAWERATGHNAEDAPFYLIRQAINFMNPDDVAKLARTVEHVAQECGERPVVVFVDTVSRVLPGADENLQKDMTLFVAACDHIRERFGASVVGVHHTSRGGNLRGSTVFDGAGDFLAQIEREEGAAIGTLRAKKIKAAADGWEESFALQVVPVSDISGASSLYAHPAAEAEAGKKRDAWPDKAVCRSILAAIDDAWTKGSPWSSYAHSRKVGRFAPMLMTSFGVKPAVAENMVEHWLMNDVLAVEIRDTHSKLKGLKVVGNID